MGHWQHVSFEEALEAGIIKRHTSATVS